MAFIRLQHLVLLGLAATVSLAWECDLRSVLLSESNNWDANTTITFLYDGDTFVDATERWTPYNAPTYLVAISPATEDDTVKAVKIARRCNVPFLATGGRHGHGSTMKGLQGGLAIDLSGLDSISLDLDADTITVGGGVREGDIVSQVHNAGRELPLGGCSCPGIVGVAIGAGVNNWIGLHGYILDSLLSVRLVTADADVIEVSETSNPELFFGIRGAGANFGIITSATFRLHPQTNNGEMLVFDVIYPIEGANMEFFEIFQNITYSMPPELTIECNVIWNPVTNAPTLLLEGMYFGPSEEGLRLLAPFLGLKHIFSKNRTVTWDQFYDVVLLGSNPATCIPGAVHTPYTASLKTLDVETLTRTAQGMAEMMKKYPGTRYSSYSVHTYNNKLAIGTNQDSTSYPWRDAVGQFVVLMSFPLGDTFTQEKAMQYGREFRDDFGSHSGRDDLAVYINSAQGDETLEQIYGARNLPRLAALKAQWDPDNVFRYNFPLPTSYP
ncbi:hypothetical protein B0I35DRAFT_381689 [Stachybotrys elegans]|uniref:FAD-binding PCMH-type domain-containing protein n=1 Tax=Stachybotrys elegans TaxID=80388 RepID=A0A8K0SBD1_9HYPO|nr:hypothetical protein B0I35DRAFT_381689 [Stachybotrys elegans]